MPIFMLEKFSVISQYVSAKKKEVFFKFNTVGFTQIIYTWGNNKIFIFIFWHALFYIQLISAQKSCTSATVRAKCAELHNLM